MNQTQTGGLVVSITTILAATNALAHINEKMVIKENDNDIPKDVIDQIDLAMSKKPFYDSLSSVMPNAINNLSKEDGSLIFSDYLPEYLAYGADSTNVYGVSNCYYNCYSNCHSACHGSRGWR